MLRKNVIDNDYIHIYEDVLQICQGKRIDADYIATRNIRDFKTEKTIADQTLAALTIMIAVSQLAEKEMMINVIMNCIVKYTSVSYGTDWVTIFFTICFEAFYCKIANCFITI